MIPIPLGHSKKVPRNSDGFFSTETSIQRPNEFAYARMSHDRVQPPPESPCVTSKLEKSDGLVHCSVKNAAVLCENHCERVMQI